MNQDQRSGGLGRKPRAEADLGRKSREDNWDGEVYGENTGHHRAFDQQLVDTFALTGAERVLDIGCGVGDFTREIADLVPDGEVLGIDKSASMIDEAAARRADNLRFEVCAAQDLAVHFAEPEHFDLIISVAALHWVPRPDHQELLQQCHRLLRPGGRMVLSFGGKGNVAAATRLVNAYSGPLGGLTDPWFFPGPADYEPLIRAAGFTPVSTQLVEQRHAFATFPDLVGWFDSQFLIAFGDPIGDSARAELRTAVLAEAEAALRRPDQSFDQDYVRLVAQAEKSTLDSVGR